MEAMSIISVPGAWPRPLVEQHVFHRVAISSMLTTTSACDPACAACVMDLAPRRPGAAPCRGAVPHVHLVAGLAQAAGHGEAHEADAQNCNFHLHAVVAA
jgi:hypothetical protein